MCFILGCDLGRWEANDTQLPIGSIEIDLCAMANSYEFLRQTIGVRVFDDWHDAHGNPHKYNEELTVMGSPTVLWRDRDICALGRAVATTDINSMYFDSEVDMYSAKTPSLPPFQTSEVISRHRETALAQRDSLDQEAIDAAFNGRAACEHYLNKYVALAEREKKYADKLADKKYVGAGASAAVPFGKIDAMNKMICLWRQVDQGSFARRAHDGDLFIASDKNRILQKALAILPTMPSQFQRDQAAIKLAESKLQWMEKMEINESPATRPQSTHELVLDIRSGASGQEALVAFLSKVIAQPCNFSWAFQEKNRVFVLFIFDQLSEAHRTA